MGDKSDNDDLITTFATSATSLMALQLFSRLFTFALNQVLFRLASPRAYGAAAIQFELLLSTILFLSREGARIALLRVDPRSRSPTTTNLAFLPLLAGLPLALTTTLGYARYAPQEMRVQPYFTAALGVYAVAALVELAAEPMHNRVVSETKTRLRMRAEGLGITMKSVTTLLVLVYDVRMERRGALSLMAFAAGQLAYAAVVFAVYVVSFGPGQLLPAKGNSGEYMDHKLLQLATTLTLQSLVKHILTESDKLVLSWFSPLTDQGGYAIAVNYGSLVARIVLQPIEETLRTYFSRVLSTSRNAVSATVSDDLNQAANALSSLLSIQISLSVILTLFGSLYLHILLPVFLPRQYLLTSAPSVLAAWIWYIPALALNGALEAFHASVATPTDLNHQSRWMVAFSALYVVAAVSAYGAGLGDASLVYANIVALAARIAYALCFARRYFSTRGRSLGLGVLIPSWSFCVVSSMAALLVRCSERVLGLEDLVSVLGHIGSGVILAGVCLFAWWTTANFSVVHKTKTM